MKRKLGPVASRVAQMLAAHRLTKNLSGLLVEGTPVYHLGSKKGYCVLNFRYHRGGKFDLTLYRCNCDDEEHELLRGITPEEFDCLGYRYAELSSARAPKIKSSEMPAGLPDDTGRQAFACIELRVWTDPRTKLYCGNRKIRWARLYNMNDTSRVAMDCPWNAFPKAFDVSFMNYTTFTIQNEVFYDFHTLTDNQESIIAIP